MVEPQRTSIRLNSSAEPNLCPLTTEAHWQCNHCITLRTRGRACQRPTDAEDCARAPSAISILHGGEEQRHACEHRGYSSRGAASHHPCTSASIVRSEAEHEGRAASSGARLQDKAPEANHKIYREKLRRMTDCSRDSADADSFACSQR
jgi:hypothetical protein